MPAPAGFTVRPIWEKERNDREHQRNGRPVPGRPIRRAPSVRLTLSYLDDTLLGVADNGREFGPTVTVNVFDRSGMRQRLRWVYRTLTIESAPGSGPALNAAAPLAADQVPVT